MKIIILIIAHDDNGAYNQMQDIWRRYMNKHPNIQSFFIKCNESVEQTTIQDDCIVSNGLESVIEGVTLKTIQSIQYCLDHFEFDFIFRANLSTFLDLDKFYSWIITNNSIDYAGHMSIANNIKFGSGCGFFLSKQASTYLCENSKLLQSGINDDVAFAILLLRKFKLVHCDKIDINDPNSPLLYEDIDYHHYRCKSDLNHVYTVEIMEKLYDKIYLKP